MDSIIELGILLVFCGIIGVAVSRIKQPPLVGYLIAGILLGLLGFSFTSMGELATILSEFGIILLLFIAGIEIKIEEIKKAGLFPMYIAIGQILFSILIGYLLISFLFQTEMIVTLFLGVVLALSSTIVVVKCLSKRRELNSPHGQILIILMVLQDITAIIAISLFNPASFSNGGLLLNIGKIILQISTIFIVLFVIGKIVLTKIFPKIADSFELVFIAGMGWCFFGVVTAAQLDFSIELGAFIAGLSIAEFKYIFEIEDKIKPLRDFGLLLFFAFVGLKAKITLNTLFNFKFIILTLFALLATPLIITSISSLMRFPRKTIFFSALLPAQSSEFSLVLITLGVRWGLVGPEMLGLFTAIVIATIIFSSTAIYRIDPLFTKFSPLLKILEWRGVKKIQRKIRLQNHAIILGFRDTKAKKALELFKNNNIPTIVVDWDKRRLKEAEDLGGIPFWGDAGDTDVWKYIQLEKARIVLSTIDENQRDDLRLARYVKKKKHQPFIIGETNDPDDASQLKEVGFNYVCFPDRDAWESLKQNILHATKTPGLSKIGF